MNSCFAKVRILCLLAGLMVPVGGVTHAQPAAAADDQGELATRALVREIQFMLRRSGFDPGPLDGVPRQLTNAAVRRFEDIQGLPVVELRLGARVPSELLARLRTEAGRAMFGTAGGAAAAPRGISPPAGEGSPANPPPPDRFSACPYDPKDFHIGANRFTPDSFLKEGFEGSTARAVASLKQRLEEGRQIADKIGLSALKEVQRQARVLQYFECRLKVEQASAKKG